VYGSSSGKRREEYQSMVKGKVQEAEWKYFDAYEHWQQMKNIMMETAQDFEKAHAGIRKHDDEMRKLLKQ